MKTHTNTNRFAESIEPISDQPFYSICQIVEIQKQKNMTKYTLSMQSMRSQLWYYRSDGPDSLGGKL